MKNLILISEALQEGNISAIAEQIKARGDVKFVMIAALPLRGKPHFPTGCPFSCQPTA